MILVSLLVLLLKSVERIRCDCLIHLKEEIGDPQPVFIMNNIFMAPDPNDNEIVYMKQWDTITAACTGENRSILFDNITTDEPSVVINCVHDDTFHSGEWVGEFKDITCNLEPVYTVEESEEICFGDNKMIRVGYKIGDVFYLLYEVCFDQKVLNTIYVSHVLPPAAFYKQTAEKNPVYNYDHFFGDINMTKLYKTKNQKRNFNILFGQKLTDTYFDKHQHLKRGQYAPHTDFPLRSEQRASYHYLNVVPQWLIEKSDDWEALEKTLRYRAVQMGLHLSVYTGSHGITTLKDKYGRDQKLYLHLDKDGNNTVPVPMYLYKLIYEPNEKMATAFVIINNPFYNNTEINNLVFCDDICQDEKKFRWLQWHPTNNATFCCEYTEFNKTINTVPNLDVEYLFH